MVSAGHDDTGIVFEPMEFYSLQQNSSSGENVLAEDKSFVAFLGIGESLTSELSVAAFVAYVRH